MLIDKENITNYIPQRFPFVMIDTLISADEKGFKSTFAILADNLFVEAGKISESALVENIAQTCAAGFGYANSLQGDGEAKLGFIGAVSKLSVHALPQPGDTITTEITLKNEFENVHLIEGVSFLAGEKLIECQMKIVLA